MGIYSDVVICCGRKAYEKIKEICDKYKFKFEDINLVNDVHILKWTDIKWYEEFTEVQEIMTLLEILDAGDYMYDLDYAYKYTRVCEETSDMVEYANPIGYDLFSDHYCTMTISVPTVSDIEEAMKYVKDTY